MTRTDIINYVIKQLNAKKYLEIGVREIQGNYTNIQCDYKIAVDPVPLDTGILPMTSDEFFEQNKETFDVIFIDGLHHADQVEKDIENSLAVLNPDGCIICHDMSPTTDLMQRVPIETTGAWTGDCWKAWVKLRASRSDLIMCVVDTDFGVGLIQKGKQTPLNLNGLELTYDNLVANRATWLNLITINEFYEL